MISEKKWQLLTAKMASLGIFDRDLEEHFIRSGGHGGQNVNKVNSKVTLHWDIKNASSISARLRQRIFSKHAGKINKEGKLVLTSQKSREQHQNRTDCYQKLRLIIQDAQKTRRFRKRTKPTKGSKQRRLDHKKQRGQVKAGRQARYEH